MKRMTALLLALSLCTGLFIGCSEAPASETVDSTPASSSEAQEATSESPEETMEGSVSLLSWYTEEAFKDVKDGFESANPGVTLEIQYAPPVQQYVDKFMLNLATDQNTDMIYLSAPVYTEALKADMMLDLSDLEIWDKKSPDILNLFEEPTGEKYGFEIDAWIGGIIYNKTIFADNNVEIPTTWDEFVAAMETISATGIIAYADQKLSVQTLSFGLFMSDVIATTPDFDKQINTGDATFTEGYLTPLTSWHEDAVMTDLTGSIQLSLSGEQILDMFATEQLAMFGGGPWDLAPIREKNPDIDFGMIPYVGEVGSPMYSGATNVSFAINKNGEGADLAVKFLEYLTTPEGMGAYQTMTGNILLVEGYEYELDPILMEGPADAALAGQFYLPNIMWTHSAALYDIFLKGAQDIIAGAQTPEQLVAALDAKQVELDAAQ